MMANKATTRPPKPPPKKSNKGTAKNLLVSTRPYKPPQRYETRELPRIYWERNHQPWKNCAPTRCDIIHMDTILLSTALIFSVNSSACFQGHLLLEDTPEIEIQTFADSSVFMYIHAELLASYIRCKDRLDEDEVQW